ncbi:MAG: ComF family protein [Planctomycetota bacterium]|nr:ComF family protein [Planctomycetota bacterium]
MPFTHVFEAFLPLGREAASVLYPRACPLCEVEDLGDGAGCAEHRLQTRVEGPRCGRCALALAPILPDGSKCPACRADPPDFAHAACLLDYRDLSTRDWILALKHGGRRDLAEPLGRLLGARLRLEPACEERRILVPVPLHATRRFERGYDQAQLLAKAAAVVANVPLVRALARLRATPPQGSTGGPSRLANVSRAFAARRCALGVRRAVAGAECWLVDDVLTSGATASACALPLKRMGALRVHVLALARA